MNMHCMGFNLHLLIGVFDLINSRGPKWLWAELVMGRNGYLPKWPSTWSFWCWFPTLSNACNLHLLSSITGKSREMRAAVRHNGRKRV